MIKSIKCPHCGESYYAEKYSTCTLVGWAPVYKDGILINKNPNVTTVHCDCLSCSKEFTYER